MSFKIIAMECIDRYLYHGNALIGLEVARNREGEARTYITIRLASNAVSLEIEGIYESRV